jgi:CRISPR system Cascade subunit CasB
VPELWPYYRELPEQGYRITPRLRAEHHTLVLFGFHQQSQRQPVNVRGSSVGAAARRLQQRARYSEEAVERRFTSAATTNNVNELAVLLRGLITQMRGEHIGLDYQRLFYDLVSWQDPDHRDQARMRWGSDYFRFPRESTE